MKHNSVKTNAGAAKKYVELGLKTKEAGKIESASGPGSSLLATSSTARFLKKILRKYKINSILDLGCGDWNWMRHIDLSYSTGSFLSPGESYTVKYLGWDIHEKLIGSLSMEFGNENISFDVKDIVTDEFPQADLIICRDVLFHMEIELGLKVINKILNSGAKYFLSTSFPKVKENTSIKKYNDIDGWGYYDINLDIEPFNLKDKKLSGVYERRQRRNIFLYDLKRNIAQN